MKRSPISPQPIALALLLAAAPTPAAATAAAEATSDLIPDRAYSRLRPFLGLRRIGFTDPGPVVGGAVLDLGVEINTRFGLCLGAELAPLVFANQRPYPSARLYLGYAREHLAISAALGSSLAWAYPQLGPVVRVGSFSGAYALVRAAWSVFPPLPLPTDLDLAVSAPLTRRVRGDLHLGGTYGTSYSAFATVGAQLLLAGSGGRGSRVLSAGLGVSWRDWSLGPMASIGFERRF